MDVIVRPEVGRITKRQFPSEMEIATVGASATWTCASLTWFWKAKQSEKPLVEQIQSKAAHSPLMGSVHIHLHEEEWDTEKNETRTDQC